MYRVVYAKIALKDIPKIRAAKLGQKLKNLILVLKEDPFQNPPSYEKLVGDLEGLYSRHINLQHRLVYEVDKTNEVVRILSVWSHYEK